jgi:AhpD family alkylhydroperoxidase
MDKTLKSIDRETQLLISVGAAVAAGCIPCLTSIVEMARGDGIEEWKLRSAAKTGQFIKDKPAGFMKAHSDELLGTHLSAKSSENGDDCCPLQEDGIAPKPAASSCDDAGAGKSGCGCS